MDISKQIENYVTLLKIKRTLSKQINWIEKRTVYVTRTEEKYLYKKIKYKQNKLESIDNKIKTFEKELNLSSKDRSCYRSCGMSHEEVKKAQGSNKRNWGKELDLLIRMFERECF